MMLVGLSSLSQSCIVPVECSIYKTNKILILKNDVSRLQKLHFRNKIQTKHVSEEWMAQKSMLITKTSEKYQQHISHPIHNILLHNSH